MTALQPTSRINEALFPAFCPVPLLPGEDPVGYDALLARLTTTIKPKDIIEEIWIQEIVALAWEAFRLRRARTAWLTAKRTIGIGCALESVCSEEERGKLKAGYAQGNEAAIAAIDERLAAAGMTPDFVAAHTLMSQWVLMERIDRMIMTTEMRRDAVLHEIERHRTSFAAALRAHIEDADFQAAKGDRQLPAKSGTSA